MALVKVAANCFRTMLLTIDSCLGRCGVSNAHTRTHTRMHARTPDVSSNRDLFYICSHVQQRLYLSLYGGRILANYSLAKELGGI
jgi:hypothetical protein